MGTRGMQQAVASRVPRAAITRELPGNTSASKSIGESDWLHSRKMMERVSPELHWAERRSILEWMAIASKLDRSDRGTKISLIQWSESLCEMLGTSAESLLKDELLPEFGALFAAKDVRAMYLERRHSLKAQAQAADHAALHLQDTMFLLKKRLDEKKHRESENVVEAPAAALSIWQGLGLIKKAPKSPIGGASGMVERLSMKYSAQVKALHEESFRGKAYFKEIVEGDGKMHAIEVAVAAKEAVGQKRINAILKKLEQESMQALLRERANADNLEALA